jgi:hypothetical protein
MEKITVEFSPEEIAALKAAAKNSHCTLEEVITRAALVELVNKGLINESAERNGWKIMRLDE